MVPPGTGDSPPPGGMHRRCYFSWSIHSVEYSNGSLYTLDAQTDTVSFSRFLGVNSAWIRLERQLNFIYLGNECVLDGELLVWKIQYSSVATKAFECRWNLMQRVQLCRWPTGKGRKGRTTCSSAHTLEKARKSLWEQAWPLQSGHEMKYLLVCKPNVIQRNVQYPLAICASY